MGVPFPGEGEHFFVFSQKGTEGPSQGSRPVTGLAGLGSPCPVAIETRSRVAGAGSSHWA